LNTQFPPPRADARRSTLPAAYKLESSVTLPANTPLSAIAGSVLPIRRAEELLATLPGVISAKIIAGDNGAVNEIHILTSTDVQPKATVRNVESALIAHLGMRVDHRKISVATTDTPKRVSGSMAAIPEEPTTPPPAATPTASEGPGRRQLYFEDVEVRRSRAKGVTCRVTLRKEKGEEVYVGEAEGMEHDRSRMELAARATLVAIVKADETKRALALDGAKLIEAFDREFIFVGVTARVGRDSQLLTGTCEVRDSVETASALAVLDATNRWIAMGK
jgi:hypothetical protein